MLYKDMSLYEVVMGSPEPPTGYAPMPSILKCHSEILKNFFDS